MRAKDWTVVVASESHVIFRLSPPAAFARRPDKIIVPGSRRLFFISDLPTYFKTRLVFHHVNTILYLLIFPNGLSFACFSR